MSRNGGVSQEQDKAIAVSRVAKVLSGSGHLLREERGGRALISMEDLSAAYAAAYPAAESDELHAGIEELLNIGEAERRADGILFDLSRLK